jgi:hypothetical protein
VSVGGTVTRVRQGDLVDYWGRDWSSHVVELDGTSYLARHLTPLGARLDLLGFRLAGDRFNVPEVRLADDQLRSTIGRPECSHIVRLCQSYRRAELAVTDLSVAMAGELVFSTWINRRDAHNHNRVFVQRVPMFYDFGAAFEEMPGEERGGFFRAGPDPGWVRTGGWQRSRRGAAWTHAKSVVGSDRKRLTRRFTRSTAGLGSGELLTITAMRSRRCPTTMSGGGSRRAGSATRRVCAFLPH